jgi:soluble lytic murein transglycosylase-like protein
MADQNLINALYAAADRYGLDRSIAYAQINQESGFNPNARSPAGAQGIAQFIPATAARFGLTNPFDPIASFEAYGKYMSFLLSKFMGRYDIALAGYNSGENRKEYENAAREGREINWSVLPAGVQTETQNYVNRILGKSGYNPGGDVTVSFETPEEPGIMAGLGGIGLLVIGIVVFLVIGGKK